MLVYNGANALKREIDRYENKSRLNYSDGVHKHKLLENVAVFQSLRGEGIGHEIIRKTWADNGKHSVNGRNDHAELVILIVRLQLDKGPSEQNCREGIGNDIYVIEIKIDGRKHRDSEKSKNECDIASYEKPRVRKHGGLVLLLHAWNKHAVAENSTEERDRANKPDNSDQRACKECQYAVKTDKSVPIEGSIVIGMIRKHRKLRYVRKKRLCDHKENGEIAERIADIFARAIALCALFDKGIFSARGLRMEHESLDKRAPRGYAPDKLAKAEAEGKKEHHRRSYLCTRQSSEDPKER